jgi:RNA polymerase sigma-70 factor (ECF subfamily)
VEHSIADLFEDVQAQVEQRAEIETILAAMARLTEEQREVLVLRLIEGLTTREIALAMNKSEGAVRALQMRGLQSLCEILGL